MGSSEASLTAGDGGDEGAGDSGDGSGSDERAAAATASTAARDAEAARRGALSAFVPRLALWVAVVAVIVGADPDKALSLMLVALAGVVTIVSDSRFPLERRLEDAGLPSREAWVPLLMLGLMVGLDLIEVDHIDAVVSEQGPVIVFILGFAVVSEGLRRCGFFHYLAYRLAERGGANTTRLTLYLFLLSSLLTYFTSNDIVILTMTPIVLSVVHQARIGNAKLLLLSQFVAANTVSMGLLIGSPTNLILGRAVNLGFLEYFGLMVVPSAMALMGTFVFVTWVNRFVERQGRAGRPGRGIRLVTRLVGSWRFSPTYSPPRFAEFRSFTPDMRRWVGLFALSVVLLAFGAASSTGLLVAAVVTATLGTTALRRDAHRHAEPTGAAFVGRTLRILPVGIVFFGLTYFVIADAVADTPFVEDDVHQFVVDHGSSHTPLPSWGAILSSGVLVNTMNDLPASALSGKVLARAEDDFETPFDRALVAQGLLVGLNIATYVTPVGALAGIIWFDILRKDKERRRQTAAAAPTGTVRGRPPLEVVTPERRDLVIYGSATFLVMTAVLGATNFGFVSLADWLAGPPNGHTEFGRAPGHLAWTLAGLGLALAVLVQFRRVLRANGVALTHLGDLLLVLTRLRLLAARHRVVTALVISLLVFLGSGFALYRVELFHADHYSAGGRWGGRNEPPFDGPVDFILWLYVFVSSGFEHQEFPESILGHFIAGGLVLGSIAAVVVVLRLIFAGSNDFNLRRKMASGEIPTDRVVVVNATMGNLRLIRALTAQPRRFVVVATRDEQLQRRLERHSNDRLAVVPFEDSARDLVAELRLQDAREIVLLSRSVSDDFDNLDLLSTLEALVGAAGITAVGAPVGASVGADGAVGADADALGALVGPGDDEGAVDQPIPALFLQQHGRELPALVRRRLAVLGPVLVQLPFDDVVRCFLVADAAGRLEDLRRLYSSPPVDPVELPSVDRHVRISGLQLSLGVAPLASLPSPPSLPAQPHSDSPGPEVIGVQVDTGGRPEWQTFAARHADELTREVTGAVVLGPAGAYPGDVGNGVRDTVYVVGCDALAQGCALDLAAGGVGRTELFVGPTDALVPAVAEASNPRVRRCRDELEVAETLGQDPGSGSGSDSDSDSDSGSDSDDSDAEGGDRDEAILVVECSDDDGFLTERLLERLSVARLHRVSTGRPVPPLYVCCRGPERARRVRNFVVDEIIDATWVESSYFEVFSIVYFHVMPAHEAVADWPAALRLRVAHRIASRLCHLEVLHPDDLWTNEAGAVRRGAGPAMSGLDAVRADRDASPPRGPLVGVVRFGIEDDPATGEPLVHVEVEVPPTDRRLGATDLLIGVPCL